MPVLSLTQGAEELLVRCLSAGFLKYLGSFAIGKARNKIKVPNFLLLFTYVR